MASLDLSPPAARYHGDQAAAPGMLDFAVNVRHNRPPEWLIARLAERLPDLARYPSVADTHRAQDAVAERHGRTRGEALPLAGAAEGFALLSNLRPEPGAGAAGVPGPPRGPRAAVRARRRGRARGRRPGRGGQPDQPDVRAAHPRAAARVAPTRPDPGGRRGGRRFDSWRAG